MGQYIPSILDEQEARDFAKFVPLIPDLGYIVIEYAYEVDSFLRLVMRLNHEMYFVGSAGLVYSS